MTRVFRSVLSAVLIAVLATDARQPWSSVSAQQPQLPAATFIVPAQSVESGDTLPVDVEVADFNNDGRRDVAIVTQNLNSARVLFHMGSTSAWPGTTSTGSLPLDNQLVAPYASGVGSGDFNGDGIVDLAVTQSGKTSIDSTFCNSTINGTVVLLGTGGVSPGFAIKSCLIGANGTNLNDAVVADFNGDGRQDLAVADSGTKGLRVYLGKGDGTFESPKFPTGLISSVSGPMWAVDVNGDHLLDIVARYSSGVEVFLGNGTGAFNGTSASIGSSFLYSQQGTRVSFAIGDVNGDARLDIVGVIRGRTDAAAAFQNYAFVSLGLGNGAFAAQAEAHLIPDGTIGSTVVADFNKDHRLDFAVADQTGHRVYVYLGYGDGTFFDAPTYAVGSQPKLMVAGDFAGPLNGWPDNWTDLFIVDNNAGAQATTWLLRQLAGTGSVTGPVVSVTSPPAGSSLQGVTTVSASATDADGVTRVEFYADNGLIGVATTAPYSAMWDTTKWTNGPRTLTARAYDTLDNLGTSTGVPITVNNGDGLPPTVSLTFPSDGSLVSSTTLVKANATDNTNIAQVEFYDGATLIGTDTIAPYEVSWDIAAVAVGSHSLTAKASDGVNVTTSAPVIVTVDHAPLASAGPDQVTEAASPAGAAVTLAGSGSDPDAGDTVSYSWSNLYGFVVGTTAVAPGVPAPLGLNYFVLTVTDNHGAATTDVMTVLVQDTHPPSVTAPAAISVAATRSEGAQGNVPTSPASAALSGFLASATAVDTVDPSLGSIPTQGVGLAGGIDVDVDDTTVFPVGTTQVRFGFVDDSGNVGTATSSVTVLSPVGGVVDVAGQPVTAKDSVKNLNQPVTVSFDQVFQPGLLTADVMATPPAPPSGYVLKSPVVFDIKTTADVFPPLDVCVQGVYAVGDALMHFENGAWVQLPTTLSPTDLCGEASSLSPFAVMTLGNTPPVAVDDAVTVAANSGATIISVLANDSDPDGDTLTVTAVSAATHGTATSTATDVSYTPTTGFSGADSFTYTIGDGHGGAATATVTVSVTAFTLTYTAGANGTIAGAASQTVAYGANGTPVTAVPNVGYHFVSWSDGVLTAARTDLNVTANISVTASFAVDTFTLTYAAGVNGTITGAASQTVAYGAAGTPVTAVANVGYHFVSWSDGVLTAARTDLNVTANLAVTASFAVDTFTLTFAAGANGTITGAASQTVAYGAAGTPVTAVPNVGYHFVSWSDGVADGGAHRHERHGQHQRDGELRGRQLHADVRGRGQRHDHRRGVADGGVRRSGHRGDGGAQRRVSLRELERRCPDGGAHRPQRHGEPGGHGELRGRQFTLTYAAGANGTITGTASQTVAYGASGTPVTAVPNVGYHFVSWSDGVLTAARTDLNVTANLAVTASFAVDTFTLTYAAGANGTITGSTSQSVAYGAAGTPVTAVPNVGLPLRELE